MVIGPSSSQRRVNFRVRQCDRIIARSKWKMQVMERNILYYSEAGNEGMVEFAMKSYDAYEKVVKQSEDSRRKLLAIKV